jgi:hypothetical protein
MLLEIVIQIIEEVDELNNFYLLWFSSSTLMTREDRVTSSCTHEVDY